VFETRVDLSNDMTWRQMIGVGVRRVVLARGELDKLEGPKYAGVAARRARRAETGSCAATADAREGQKAGARSRESKGSAGGGVVGGTAKRDR